MKDRGSGYRFGPVTTFSLPVPDDVNSTDEEIYAHWIGRNTEVGIVTDVQVTKHQRTIVLTISHPTCSPSTKS